MRKLMFSLMVAALAIAVAMPASAAPEISLYGDARMQTFWWRDSAETANLNLGDIGEWWGANQVGIGQPHKAASTARSDTDMEMGMDVVTTRVGVRAKEGPISFNVEMRPKNDGAVRLRHWYGTWDFGAGSLLIGQTWTPDVDGMVTTDFMQGGGSSAFFGDQPECLRQPQLALWFPVPSVGGLLKIAFMSPTAWETKRLFGANDYDVAFPKVISSFRFTMGPATIVMTGGYQSYKEVWDTVTTDRSETITAYQFGISPRVDFGPFNLSGSIWFGQNMNEYGWAGGSQAYSTGFGFSPIMVGGNVEDSDWWGYAVVGKFKLTPMVTIVGGYSQISCKRTAAIAGVGDDEDTQGLMYLTIPIQIVKNLWINPEFGRLDWKDRKVNGVTTDEGNSIYGGVYWRIAF